MNDNLNKFEKFFNYNLKIKKILHESSFKENTAYTKDNRNLIEYKEKLVKNLEELEFYIMNSMKMFDYNEYTLMNIQNKFNLYRKTLINLKTETKHLKSFYTTVFSDMSEELIENLSKNCKGYYLFNDKNIITEATTINEMLHCIHHSITNDEYYYQSMPIKMQKNNSENYPIMLYGKENTIAKKIYEAFPLELECGWTDIVGLTNKVLIMVRDRGHALTIEITKEEETLKVDYFIPKICNVEMVNKLKGVKKVTSENKYTVGKFITTEENLTNELIKFISMVPTDSDIIINLKR